MSLSHPESPVVGPKGECSFGRLAFDKQIEYWRQVEESKGFSITFPIIPDGSENLIVPLTKQEYDDVHHSDINQMILFAVEKLQEKTGKLNLQLVEIIKVNKKQCKNNIKSFYFTLKLRDDDNVEKVYRANVEQEEEESTAEKWLCYADILLTPENHGGDSQKLCGVDLASAYARYEIAAVQWRGLKIMSPRLARFYPLPPEVEEAMRDQHLL